MSRPTGVSHLVFVARRNSWYFLNCISSWSRLCLWAWTIKLFTSAKKFVAEYASVLVIASHFLLAWKKQNNLLSYGQFYDRNSFYDAHPEILTGTTITTKLPSPSLLCVQLFFFPKPALNIYLRLSTNFCCSGAPLRLQPSPSMTSTQWPPTSCCRTKLGSPWPLSLTTGSGKTTRRRTIKLIWSQCFHHKQLLLFARIYYDFLKNKNCCLYEINCFVVLSLMKWRLKNLTRVLSLRLKRYWNFFF